MRLSKSGKLRDGLRVFWNQDKINLRAVLVKSRVQQAGLVENVINGGAMNYKTKVHVTGVIAILEWENTFENRIESLTVRTLDGGNTFGIYLCDENAAMMSFPGVGTGPVRLVERMKRAEQMSFVTMYGAEWYGDAGVEYVRGVAGLINYARLEMLKRRKDHEANNI